MSTAGTTTNWAKSSFDVPRSYDMSSLRNHAFGITRFPGLCTHRDIFLSKVQVAADYSDSMSDSSNGFRNPGYHPLEDVKDCGKTKTRTLTDAEIARTTIEANSNALLVFPGSVHCEPHKNASWIDQQYIIDDYGDIFFEIFDDENILLDWEASSPVTALIGMDDLHHKKHRRMTATYNDGLINNETNFDAFLGRDDNEDNEVTQGMQNTLHQIHPIYFSKCLLKATQTKHIKKMDHPSNGVYIIGFLRPAFEDEVDYIRRFFHGEDTDDHISDGKDEDHNEEQMASAYDLTDGKIVTFNSETSERIGSTLYKLVIMNMDLFSLYGTKSTIDLQDFQDAEPDVLLHCASNIIERFNEHEMKCDIALKTLCRKKKGLLAETACLVGIDSLGMDVRVFFGTEAQTVWFPFNSRTTSANAVERKILRMLFPRSRKKSLHSRSESKKDSESF